MINVRFFFTNGEHVDFKYPESPVGVRIEGEKPYKALITGVVEQEDPGDLSYWAENSVKVALAKGGKVIIDLSDDLAMAMENQRRIDGDSLSKGTVDSRRFAEGKVDPGTPIMKFFEYDHLPVALQEVSKTLCEAAIDLNQKLPDGEEKYMGLRKLLEAKDCFVRAMYLKENTES